MITMSYLQFYLSCFVGGFIAHVLTDLTRRFLRNYLRGRKEKSETYIAEQAMLRGRVFHAMKAYKGDMVVNPPEGSNEQRYPHKWNCGFSNCSFSVWATELETMESIRDNHLSWHEGRSDKAGPIIL